MRSIKIFKQEIVFKAKIGKDGFVLKEVIDVTPEDDEKQLSILKEISKDNERLIEANNNDDMLRDN